MNASKRDSQMERAYVLYGAGWESEKFLYRHREIINNVAYCIDEYHSGDIHGIPIVSLDGARNLEKYQILVATVWDTFCIIRELLQEKGLKEFTNFIWSRLFGKKLVLINANCHGAALVDYLHLSRQFVDNYCVYPMAQIHLNEKKELGNTLIRKCDVYIHQDIRADNSVGYKLSDEYVLAILKPSCLAIAIPNFQIMARWLFPTDRNKESYKRIKGQAIGGILYENEVMEFAFSRGLRTCDEYVDFYNEWTYDEDWLQALYDSDMEKLLRREKNWDIKVSGFILEQYKTVPCFSDAGHPSKYLMREIARKVASMLELNDIDDEAWDFPLGIPQPMLPCVEKYFGIDYKMKTASLRSSLAQDDFSNLGKLQSLREYVQCYLWWFHSMDVS